MRRFPTVPPTIDERPGLRRGAVLLAVLAFALVVAAAALSMMTVASSHKRLSDALLGRELHATALQGALDAARRIIATSTEPEAFLASFDEKVDGKESARPLLRVGDVEVRVERLSEYVFLLRAASDESTLQAHLHVRCRSFPAHYCLMVADEPLQVGESRYEGAIYAPSVLLLCRVPIRFGGTVSSARPPRFATVAAGDSQFAGGCDTALRMRPKPTLRPLPPELKEMRDGDLRREGDTLIVKTAAALEIVFEGDVLRLKGPLERRLPLDGLTRVVVDGPADLHGRLSVPLLLRVTGRARITDDLLYVDGEGRTPLEIDERRVALDPRYAGRALLLVAAPEILYAPRADKKTLVVCAALIAYEKSIRFDTKRLHDRLIVFGFRFCVKRPYRKRGARGFGSAVYIADTRAAEHLPPGAPLFDLPRFSGFRFVTGE